MLLRAWMQMHGGNACARVHTGLRGRVWCSDGASASTCTIIRVRATVQMLSEANFVPPGLHARRVEYLARRHDNDGARALHCLHLSAFPPSCILSFDVSNSCSSGPCVLSSLPDCRPERAGLGRWRLDEPRY